MNTLIIIDLTLFMLYMLLNIATIMYNYYTIQRRTKMYKTLVENTTIVNLRDSDGTEEDSRGTSSQFSRH